MIRLSDINFEYNRFWSSPDYLPVINIITIVLKRPSIDDIILLVRNFGLDEVRQVFEELKKDLLSKQTVEFIEFVLKNIEIEIKNAKNADAS